MYFSKQLIRITTLCLMSSSLLLGMSSKEKKAKLHSSSSAKAVLPAKPIASQKLLRLVINSKCHISITPEALAVITAFGEIVCENAQTPLSQAKVLDLSNNALKRLPSGFEQLRCLTNLSLANNELTELFPHAWKFEKLETIDISCNKLGNTILDWHCTPKLQVIIAHHAQIHMLHFSICVLVDTLTKADLSYNNFQEVTPALYVLKSLVALDLSHNKLREISTMISGLQNLQELYLDSNLLSRVPEQMGNLPALRVLSLKGNALVTIPEQIGNLSNLQELYLDSNNVESLPDGCLKGLKSLIILSVIDNRLARLPEELATLVGLKRLLIAHNLLTELPSGLSQLTKLEQLAVDGNEIENLSECMAAIGLTKFLPHDSLA